MDTDSSTNRKRKGDDVPVACAQPSRLREQCVVFGDVTYVFRVSPDHVLLASSYPEAANATVHWQSVVESGTSK
jgi:hypothetical protein